MIYESGIVSATNTDLMTTGRLNTIPYSAPVVFEFSADKADATDNFSLTIQLPSGDVPVDGQLVPAARDANVGYLNENELVRFVFMGTQGGHFIVNLTQTGVAIVTYRIVLT